jgi:hypothetical protein
MPLPSQLDHANTRVTNHAGIQSYLQRFPDDICLFQLVGDSLVFLSERLSQCLRVARRDWMPLLCNSYTLTPNVDAMT